MSHSEGKHQHGNGEHNFTKYSQYVGLYSPKKVDIPSPKIKEPEDEKTTTNLQHLHEDWKVTSYIALAILGTILVVLALGLHFFEIDVHHKAMIGTISTIGLITFFGMLIVSSHHSIMKEDSKGTMRKALASSFVVVYLIVFSMIVFGGINLAVFTDGQDEEDDSRLTPNQILDHLTKIVMVILGFYFGTKGAKEIVVAAKKPNKNKDEKQKPKDMHKH